MTLPTLIDPNPAPRTALPRALRPPWPPVPTARCLLVRGRRSCAPPSSGQLRERDVRGEPWLVNQSVSSASGLSERDCRLQRRLRRLQWQTRESQQPPRLNVNFPAAGGQVLHHKDGCGKVLSLSKQLSGQGVSCASTARVLRGCPPLGPVNLRMPGTRRSHWIHVSLHLSISLGARRGQ